MLRPNIIVFKGFFGLMKRFMMKDADKKMKTVLETAERRLHELRDRRRAALDRLRDAAERKRIARVRKDVEDL